MTLVVIFVAFFLIGFPDGALGTAWPDIRREMTRSVGDLSWLISLSTVGYTVATAASGHLTGRFGTSRVLVTSLAISGVGAAGFAAAPGFVTLTLAIAVLGAGGGLLDAVVNAWLAVHHGPRAMGFLHAFFGFGAMFGPLAIAAVLARDWSWRGVFVALALAQAVLVVLTWLKRRDYDAAGASAPIPATSHGTVPRLLALTLAWFFVIVGLEVAVASWGFSLLVEAREVAEGPAAIWAASFWAAMTAGRLGLGLFGHRVPGLAALRGALAVTTVGAIVLWLNLSIVPPGLGLPILGLGISILFPVMVLITPEWMGEDRTGRAVGYQFAAASVGAVSFSLLIGPLADRLGLEVLGPVLFVGIVVAVGLLVMMQRTASGPGGQPHLPEERVADAEPRLEPDPT